MSDQLPGTNPAGPSGPGNLAANPAMVVRRRPASITLRGADDGSGGQSLMDPANQSLADALKITYRLLQIAMLGLFIMFLFSGLQSVQTGERGIRVLAGAVQEEDLPPGFQFSLPRPIGEIVKIKTGAEPLRLEEQFFPKIPPEMRSKPINEIAMTARDRLDPVSDGHLITADLGIFHARVAAQWQRKDISKNARNLNPEFEESIVRAAIMRGVVHSASKLTTDELYRNQPDPARTTPFPDLTSESRRMAQQILDANSTGIEIINLTIEDRNPPLRLLSAFGSVLQSQADANKEIAVAQSERAESLAKAAGSAAPVLLDLIDRYDVALSTGTQPDAEAILATIDDIIEGKPITVAGAPADAMLTGQASSLMSDAKQYRSSVVSRAQADARTFQAKQVAFKANPGVLMAGEWSEAFTTFLSRDTVQMFMLPPGRSVDLWLNRDPDLARQQETIRTQAKARADELNRMKALDEAKFKKVGNTTTTITQ